MTNTTYCMELIQDDMVSSSLHVLDSCSALLCQYKSNIVITILILLISFLENNWHLEFIPFWSIYLVPCVCPGIIFSDTNARVGRTTFALTIANLWYILFWFCHDRHLNQNGSLIPLCLHGITVPSNNVNCGNNRLPMTELSNGILSPRGERQGNCYLILVHSDQTCKWERSRDGRPDPKLTSHECRYCGILLTLTHMQWVNISVTYIVGHGKRKQTRPLLQWHNLKSTFTRGRTRTSLNMKIRMS